MCFNCGKVLSILSASLLIFCSSVWAVSSVSATDSVTTPVVGRSGMDGGQSKGGILPPAAALTTAAQATAAISKESIISNQVKQGQDKKTLAPISLPPPQTTISTPTTAKQPSQVKSRLVSPIPPAHPQDQPRASAPLETLQLELEFKKDTRYKVFSLPNPPRIVVDVSGDGLVAEVDKMSLKNTPVQKIRTGRRDNGVLRIAFDLKEPMGFKIQEVASNSANKSGNIKLILKLFPKKAA